MDESRLDEIRNAFESLMPEMKIEGLSLDDLSFDFYSESVDVRFGWNGKQARLRLTMERVRELQEARTFSIKRLRDTLHKTFGVDEEE